MISNKKKFYCKIIDFNGNYKFYMDYVIIQDPLRKFLNNEFQNLVT
jgi:hypothetical protein